MARAKCKIAPYLFVSPFYIAFLAFMLGPIVFSFYAGFTSWRLGSSLEFVGLANYVQLFNDPLFRVALTNTLYFTVVYNALMIPAAFILAVILDSRFVKGSHGFRTTLFTPITMSLIAIAIVFDLILHREFGLLNLALNTIGIPIRPDWLRNPRLALGSIVLMRLWRATGYYTAILLAGLQTIPPFLYDAAKVDGAGPFSRMYRITIPLMKPFLAFAFIMSTIHSLQLFDEPWLLNQGGPGYSTLTVIIYLYQNAFGFHKFAYGSAISFVLSLIIFGFSLLQLRLAREK